mgnify:CR=1 FL=1
MKYKQEEKAKNQTEGTTKFQKIIIFSIILTGALIILVAPLIHMKFPVRNQEIVDYKNSLASKEKKIISKIQTLKTKYQSKEISAENYIIKQEKLAKEIEESINFNKTLLAKKIDSQRLFGWSSTRKFLIGFGIRLPYLILSLIISILVVENKRSHSGFKNGFFILQISCFAMAFYQLIWCFWSSDDFPMEVYWYAFLIFSIAIAVISSYFFRYYESNIDKIIKLKGDFLDFLVELRNGPIKDLVKVAQKGNITNKNHLEDIKKVNKAAHNVLYNKAAEIIDNTQIPKNV